MDPRTFAFAGLFLAPNVHPATVHFPLVLVPTAFVLYAGGHFWEKPGVRLAGRVCLWLALVSAMIAVFTGTKAVNDLPRDAAVLRLLGAHRAFAMGFTIATTALAGWAGGRPERGLWSMRAFLLALALDSLLALETADLGSQMVYVHGAATPAAPPAALPRRP